MKRGISIVLALVLGMILFVSCQQAAAAAPEQRLKIGVSFASLQEERWNREKTFFENKAEELGVDIVFQDANNDENIQNNQVENMVTDGIDCLIIVAFNARTAATSVRYAKDAGIPVVCYTKMIDSDQLDVYVGFVVRQLGQELAKPAIEVAPKGNYAIIAGAATDNNTALMRAGVYDILQPYIDSGDIKVVFDQDTEAWSPERAMANAENALTQNNNDIDAIISFNDGMAGGVIQALRAQGLAGQIPVIGGDGELAACQRIVEGTQLCSLFYPLQEQAEKAIIAAVELAKGQIPSEIDTETPNEVGMVPTITVYAKTITKDTMKEIIIDGDIFTMEEVYANIPRDEWPE